MRRERFGDGLVAELVHQHDLGDQNTDGYPALLTKALAERIGHELVLLAHGHCAHKQHDPRSRVIHDVRWWNPQDRFDVESVEFEYHDDGADSNDSKPAFNIFGVPPVEFSPAVRRELAENSLELAAISWDGPQVPPVVRLGLKDIQGFDAQPYSETIANDGVQNPVVPPTLTEIRQLVLQGVLQYFECDAQNETHPVVAEDDGLGPPPGQMEYDKPVHLGPNIVVGIFGNVRIVYSTVRTENKCMVIFMT